MTGFITEPDQDVLGPVSPTNWADFLKWMPGADKVIDFEASKEKATQILNDCDLLFCLDFNILYRTKNMEPVLKSLNCTKVLIDHHEQPQVEVFNYGISSTAKSSTSAAIITVRRRSQRRRIWPILPACVGERNFMCQPPSCMGRGKKQGSRHPEIPRTFTVLHPVNDRCQAQNRYCCFFPCFFSWRQASKLVISRSILRSPE